VQSIHLALSIGFALFACEACGDGPPIRTASGEHVTGVSYEERFPLSSDTHETTFHGDRLRRAVEMMDRTGMIAMSGTYQAIGALDKSMLIVTITAENTQRKLVIKNCAEPTVCGFFANAVKSELVDKAPVVCRDAIPCTR
jgi:hypothetical protein